MTNDWVTLRAGRKKAFAGPLISGLGEQDDNAAKCNSKPRKGLKLL